MCIIKWTEWGPFLKLLFKWICILKSAGQYNIFISPMSSLSGQSMLLYLWRVNICCGWYIYDTTGRWKTVQYLRLLCCYRSSFFLPSWRPKVFFLLHIFYFFNLFSLFNCFHFLWLFLNILFILPVFLFFLLQLKVLFLSLSLTFFLSIAHFSVFFVLIFFLSVLINFHCFLCLTLFIRIFLI